MITVGHPCGLCNRLDVITIGYLLAERQGTDEIELLWPLNDRHMPVSFHQLFEALPRGRVSEVEILPDQLASLYTGIATLPPDFRESERYGVLLRSILERAVPEVRTEVAEFARRHSINTTPGAPATVGVHIRRSERPMPLCEFAQPLRYYEAVMRSFPSNTRFFVSTDSQEAYRWLERRFAGRLTQRLKDNDDRTSVAGVREGLIDLLLLSRCSAIIGTSDSSFSRAAAVAGNSSIFWVRFLPGLPDGWPAFSLWRWLWAYRHFAVESTLWRRWLYWNVRPYAICIPRIPARCLRLVRSAISRPTGLGAATSKHLPGKNA